jgi:hypothetical protein
MEMKKNPKNPKKYICSTCDFHTGNKKDFERHVLTAKHQKNIFGNVGNKMEMSKNPTFVCECNKIFCTNAGLWKHKNKCVANGDAKQVEMHVELDNEEDVKLLSTLVLEVVKQNKELMSQHNETQKQNQELTKQLFEICKNGTNNTMINNNSYNKTFNLNVFLNEECKDAMNIMDFVDSLKIQLSDLENVGKLGFIDGISNIIVKNLKALDVNKRPVHCSDSKREIMYIKDEDKWEKDNDDKLKLRKAIKYIAHKNTKLLPEFKAKYPDCIYSDSRKSDQYNKLIIESMGGNGDNDSEKENKIIRKIAKEVIIDKT